MKTFYKRLLLVSVLFFSAVVCQAQIFFINDGSHAKPDSPAAAVSKNRTYSAIVNTDTKKADLMSKIRSFIVEENLAEAKDIETTEFDDGLSEMKIRFGYIFEQLPDKTMGALTVFPPVILRFDAAFSFNDNKQLMVTFTEFEGKVLSFANEKKVLGEYKYIPESKPKEKNGFKLSDYISLVGDEKESEEEPFVPNYNEYDSIIMREYHEVLLTNAAINKMILKLNGVDAKVYADYKKNRAKMIQVYKDALLDGSTEIITLENAHLYFPPGYNAPGIGSKKTSEKRLNQQLQTIEFYRNNGFVLGINNYYWDNYCKDTFNSFFSEIARLLNGSIESVAQDGKILYEQQDGKCMPVDAKERKKWEKEGISL